MPHYGILREHRFDDIEDVRGAEVYGVNDEKLGTIQDVIFDHSSGDIRYIVVDSGGLLSSKKDMVPANRISPYGNHDDKFYAELDKERLEMLPEFNDETLKSESDWNDYEKKYEEHWKTTGDVLHHETTGRIITPPSDQIEAGGGNLSGKDRESLARDFTPEKRGKQDDYLGVASSGDDITLRPQKPSIGGREDVRLMQQGRSNQDSSPTFNQGTVGSDQSLEGSRVTDQPGLQEPGIYKVDAVPEAEKRSDMNEPLNANYGRRWIGFQNRLRQGRDKVVVNCPLCGTQKKVA